MKPRVRLAALSLIAACGGPGAAIAAQESALPADVTAFVEWRDICEELRNGGAYDEERGDFAFEAHRDGCSGGDVILSKLRRRYAHNPVAKAALTNYGWMDYAASTDGGNDPRSLDLPASGKETSVSIPVSVALEDIDPAGVREVRILRTRGSLVALTDGYASSAQSMSRCQAGEEVYFRVVDKVALKERYSKLIDSCRGRALSGDPPIAWKSAYTATLNLLLEPEITVRLGANGTVTHTP